MWYLARFQKHFAFFQQQQKHRVEVVSGKVPKNSLCSFYMQKFNAWTIGSSLRRAGEENIPIDKTGSINCEQNPEV